MRSRQRQRLYTDTGHDKYSSHNYTDHIAQISQLGHGGHQDIRIFIRIIRTVKELIVQLIKLLYTFILMTENLNDLLSGHHLFNVTVNLTDIFLLSHKVSTALT